MSVPAVMTLLLLQVISKKTNKTPKKVNEENKYNLVYDMDLWAILLCHKICASTPFKMAFRQDYNCFVFIELLKFNGLMDGGMKERL